VKWLIPMYDMTHLIMTPSYIYFFPYIYMFTMTHLNVCEMTYSYLWHDPPHNDSFICLPCLIHMYVTWLIPMRDMTYSYVWQDPPHNDSFLCLCLQWLMCLTWLIPVCDMTHLIHMCDMTHLYVWHDSFIRATQPSICTEFPHTTFVLGMTHS